MEIVDETRINELVDRLDIAGKVRLVTGRDFWTLQPLPEIGLRSVVLSDGPAGVRGEVWDERSPSVNFPSPTCLSAGWDRSAVYRVGEALGAEAVRKGVDVVLAPTINLHRSPYGGRHFEALSEDPLLTAEIATAYVQGVQSRGVAATVKHYVANDSETERFSVDVRVDERTLREVYLAAFEGPVVGGGRVGADERVQLYQRRDGLRAPVAHDAADRRVGLRRRRRKRLDGGAFARECPSAPGSRDARAGRCLGRRAPAGRARGGGGRARHRREGAPDPPARRPRGRARGLRGQALPARRRRS